MPLFRKETKDVLHLVQHLNQCTIEDRRFRPTSNEADNLANYINELSDEVVRLRYLRTYQK